MWEYGADGQPVALHTAGRTIRFEYDPVGREVRRVLGPNAVVDQTWTQANRINTQTITRAGGERVQSRSYAYRADGELVGVHDQLTGPREFVLGAGDRVVAVRGAGWAERYDYDPAGNLVNASWPTSSAEPQLGGRDYRGMLVQRAGNARYEHDAQGRLVRKQLMSQEGASFQYTWDANDRLTEVLTPSGARWRYRYDAMGRRIAKERIGPDGRTAVERIDFTWDGTILVEQARFDASAPQGRVTVWEHTPGTFQPVAQGERVPGGPQGWVEERFHTIVTDLLGTPTELVDDRGGVAEVNRTPLWGGAGSGSSTPLRFPGQYFDAETGLHYNYLRYYDPMLARYLTPDPLGLEAGPNNHVYVGNPNSWSDPLGLVPCLPDAVRRHGGRPHTSGAGAKGYMFPSQAAAGRAARETVGPLGRPTGGGINGDPKAPLRQSQPIRKSDFRGGPASWVNNPGIIGRETVERKPGSTESVAGWRNDSLGHDFNKNGKHDPNMVVEPHFNVWGPGVNHKDHFFYPKR
ncbi:RHS repeat-associated core domain-containing protein [Saccharopolyspora sp. NPDC000359]|uniref:RHS repeat domain-containing protein n=1 Tax=Saccharopolyspora sp. NPDC000359 TaxID=3154251 RepID=UPI0033164EF6